ncbi:MAG: hypothetical protein PHQ96_05165 [Candidatus Omnitrophica bacterium]|nr:hypothetical protein [Candidatus Omnitrophota bacterium]
MNKKELILACSIVLALVGSILGFGFQKYYAYSQGENVLLNKTYIEEDFYSIYLGHKYVFDRQPALRLFASIFILGGFLLYILKGEEILCLMKPPILKMALEGGVVIRTGKPHPRYPQLLVEKINHDGNIKIKGLRGFRDAYIPFLKGLTKRQSREFEAELKQLEGKKKA